MLFNKTQNKKITEKTRFADSFFKKFRGLMLEKKESFDYALIFDFGSEKKTGASIHMLFVFFPIDLVYLDEKKKVTDIKTAISPWTLNYTPKNPSRFLAELPVGAAKGIQIGDKLDWACSEKP
ncbi:MAG: DUF192 domain-containing protein [Candidatus Micrarchaeota archaeon]